MAKSKGTGRGKATSNATTRRTTGPRVTASRGRVGKGEALEVGNPRRETGATGPLPSGAAGSMRGQAPLQLPGEKAVKPTKQTVPVAPKRRSPGADEPLPDAAVDRRRQVIGADDKPRRR
jgi:hypothetical protein